MEKKIETDKDFINVIDNAMKSMATIVYDLRDFNENAPPAILIASLQMFYENFFCKHEERNTQILDDLEIMLKDLVCDLRIKAAAETASIH